jgi:Domain of unknown function (DUF1996)
VGLITPPSLKEVALMMRRTILLVATMALSLFAANCVLLLAQDLTHPQRAEAYPAIKPKTGFSQDCQQSAAGKFDPIVFPTTPPPVGHRHVFFGSTAISYNSTLADLQAGTSNCTFRSTFPTTNKSAYWAPDLKLRTGKWAGIGFAAVYYRAGNLSDAEIAKMQAFPPGLKMIVDNVPDSTVSWECTKFHDVNNPLYNYPQDCPVGYNNRLHISFPQCGIDGSLDSDNHRRHMAFPVNGQCPADHPIVFPRISYSVEYRAQKGAGAQLSSGDAYTSAHADAFEAWDTQNLQALIDKCIKSGVNCGKTP